MTKAKRIRCEACGSWWVDVMSDVFTGKKKYVCPDCDWEMAIEQ